MGLFVFGLLSDMKRFFHFAVFEQSSVPLLLTSKKLHVRKNSPSWCLMVSRPILWLFHILSFLSMCGIWNLLKKLFAEIYFVVQSFQTFQRHFKFPEYFQIGAFILKTGNLTEVRDIPTDKASIIHLIDYFCTKLYPFTPHSCACTYM